MRYLIIMLVSVVIARWIHSEIELISPNTIAYIDYAIEKIDIPTHDKWDTKKVAAFLDSFKTDLAAQNIIKLPAGTETQTLNPKQMVHQAVLNEELSKSIEDYQRYFLKPTEYVQF
ncbi:hypothetical protein OAO01_00415 [Oligoflexia bacterium]|nr:hypothetical protein [Oligoflexia bacterium]